MKEMLKKALLILAFGILFQSLVYAQSASWLSETNDEKYEVSIIGPIVDPDREEITEKQKSYLEALEQSIDKMIDRPQRYLPDNYLDTIRKLKKQRWNPDPEEFEITADEEEQLNAWLEIVGDGTEETPGVVLYQGIEFDADNVKIAEILGNSYSYITSKPSGLELAFRLNLDKSNFTNLVMIDGYRLVYDQGGTGYAEWFSIPINVEGFSRKKIEMMSANAVKAMMLLPFFDKNTMTFNPGFDTRIKFWKTPSLPGEISTESEPFELEKTPITEEYYEQCREIGWCEKADEEDGFVLVGNEREARKYCSTRQKYLPRSAAIPFLYQDFKEILKDKYIWVEDNAKPIKVTFGEFDYIQLDEGDRDEEALVWCQQDKPSFLYQFEEQEKDVILGRSMGAVQWYNPEIAKQEDYLFQSNGNHVEVLEPDSDHPTIVRGNVLLEKNDQLETGMNISYDLLNDEYSALTFMSNNVNITLVSSSMDVLQEDIPLQKYLYTSGKLYSGYTWSLGVNYLGIAFTGETKKGDDVTVNISPGIGAEGTNLLEETIYSLSCENGMERPVYLISDMRWGIYGGLDMINIYQVIKYSDEARGDNQNYSARVISPNFSFKISYGFSGLVIYLGQTYTIPTSADFEGEKDNPYFESVTVEGGVGLTLGFAYIFD